MLWFNPAAGNQDQTAARSPLPFPPVGWRGEMDKRENSWAEIETV